MTVISTICLAIILALGYSGPAMASPWDYKRQDKWPKECVEGKEQSPIPLSPDLAKEESFPPLVFEHYNATHPVTIQNTGKTVDIRLNSDLRPAVTDGALGLQYILNSIHFHWPSEHTIEDVRFPLELHMVHFASDDMNISTALKHRGHVAVFAILFEISPEDDTKLSSLFDIIEELPKHPVHDQFKIENLYIDDFLPRDRAGFYRYNGSLTTPGCAEGIIWTVFTNTLPVSERQLRMFPMLTTDDNEYLNATARELQSPNGRIISLKRSPLKNTKQKPAEKKWTKVQPKPAPPTPPTLSPEQACAMANCYQQIRERNALR